ncbi:MAG TPA: hypothetical protein VEI57_00005 [Nitrospirota bacterium]|nr:hypothetical protein [Nitrospirota bacterium]
MKRVAMGSMQGQGVHFEVEYGGTLVNRDAWSGHADNVSTASQGTGWAISTGN